MSEAPDTWYRAALDRKRQRELNVLRFWVALAIAQRVALVVLAGWVLWRLL